MATMIWRVPPLRLFSALLFGVALLLWRLVVTSNKGTLSYEAPEPFPFLHDFHATGNSHNCSPDPLVNYTWSKSTNTTQLQVYRATKPAGVVVDPPHAAVVQHNGVIAIYASCSIRWDWGVERAAWLEFTAIETNATTMTASISEFLVPQKTLSLVQYGQHTYRLEPNPELYEGVRYTWLHINVTTTTTSGGSQNNNNPPSSDVVMTITNASLVAKIKPVEYTGSFSYGTNCHQHHNSLTKIWYTGAYGVRLNMEADQFNSVLVERGDRVSIVGTNHPVMATARVAFQVEDMIHKELLRTNAGSVHGHASTVIDHEIVVYPIYWTLSVMDWYWSTGNTTGFLELVPDVRSLLDARIQDISSGPPTLELVWMAWDDRLGDGWCRGEDCGQEAQLVFALILVRACRDLGNALLVVAIEEHGSEEYQELGNQYLATAQWLGSLVRQRQSTSPIAATAKPFLEGWGVHSAAHVLAVGAPYVAHNDTELHLLFQKYLNDSVTICSLSNFDQYWILQGLANAPYGSMDHAISSVHLCWGTALPLIHNGCFWEMYSPEWASFLHPGEPPPIGISLCHPWAAGVSAWLSHFVGGIQPLLPGYEQVLMVPYVSPRFPGPVQTTMQTLLRGSIAVTAEWSSDDNDALGTATTSSTLHMTFDTSQPGLVGIRTLLPSRTSAEAKCRLNVTSVRAHGVPVATKSLTELLQDTTVPQTVRTALAGRFVPSVGNTLRFLFVDDSKQRHQYSVTAQYTGDDGCQAEQEIEAERPTTAGVEVTAIGIPHFPPFPLPYYPASSVLDRKSKGDGITKYAADGYVLFGYSKDSSDVQSLPSYVTNVTVHHHNYNGWASLPRTFLGDSGRNTTYLPDPRRAGKNTAKRALGMIGDDFQFLGRGIIVDVDMDQSKLPVSRLAVSGYTVAHFPGEKYTLRVEDRETLNVIAPTRLISKHSQGVWWNIEYNRSLRIRLVAITGAHISALAFGSARNHTAVNS